MVIMPIKYSDWPHKLLPPVASPPLLAKITSQIASNKLNTITTIATQAISMEIGKIMPPPPCPPLLSVPLFRPCADTC